MYSGRQSVTEVRFQAGARKYEDLCTRCAGPGGHDEVGEGIDHGCTHAKPQVRYDLIVASILCR